MYMRGIMYIYILLPFFTRHPDALRRAHALADVDNEAASQWHWRAVGMPASKRRREEVIGGYDR